MAQPVEPLLTREYLSRIGGWPVLKEADQIWKSGRVLSAEYQFPFLWGRVQTANGPVQSRLKVSARLFEVENLCQCRQARVDGTICPHVLALGLKMIAPAPAMAAPAVPAVSAASRPTEQATHAVAVRPSRFTSETEESEVELTVSFLLPVNFPEAWESGNLRVIVEAAREGEPGRPLDTVLRGLPGRICVGADSLPALRFLETRAAEPLPSMWLISRKDFDAFATSLIGCSTVGLGKKAKLQIRRSDATAQITVETARDGRIHLGLVASAPARGIALVSSAGRWWFRGDCLEFESAPGPMVSRLARGPVILERTEVPRFVSEELPRLERQQMVRICERTRRIECREDRPQIRFILDGTPASLSARAEAVYEGNPVALAGSIAEGAGVIWTADLQDPLRYHSRSIRDENQARDILRSAGFLPGTRQPEFHILTGEESCLRFLAEDFPTWQQRWQIEVQPRLQAFLRQCDWIRPQASLKPGGSGESWIGIDFSYGSADGSVALSAGEVQQLLQTGRHSRRLRNGRTALLPMGRIQEWQEALQDCHEEAGLGAQRVDIRCLPYLTSVLPLGSGTWRPPRDLLEPQAVTLPPGLTEILRPYQVQGIEWIAHLAQNSFGGILADEMGLGKTLQTLAYLEYRRQKDPLAAPALVVAPTSLLHNWESECRRYTPALRTMVWHGTDRHERSADLDQADLLITSYTVLRRDLERWRDRTFDMVVLDEAQHIKNRLSQNAQAVKALRTETRLILTGTPMENSLLDLWSMFDFLMPGYLGSAPSFKERYEQPITKSRDAAAQKRLNQRLKPFVLRRTKKEVASELPEKIETILWTELTAEQKQVYSRLVEAGRKEVFELAGRGQEGRRTMAMLTVLTRLRQASCHLDLLPSTGGAAWKEPSGKLEALGEMVDEAIAGGHRLLIFSQFVRMLKLVEAYLVSAKIKFCYLDGSTVDRAAEVARFQETPEIPVFLISLKAGGTGLNLTGADTVLHLDPWWNPAVEDQATARAHRLGQSRIVTSYKLIARGTVEEKIVELQNRKKELITQTLLSESSLLHQLDAQEWHQLLDCPF